ncbi:hypothetical protein RHMOL_Rhmol07G0112700 [Rhododendron molle]|uniref:Uncharacterized protein n=1 Tax=Rhododendron molle TaxID=49168 RepID=A0ACC0N0H7_RHOML|nr:hypothetical protein RHMOL_Rhmol07G0112700 [Rhododendron molle]
MRSRGCSICNVTASFSLMSNPLGSISPGRDQSKKWTNEARTKGTCFAAIGMPGHILLPAPKGKNP